MFAPRWITGTAIGLLLFAGAEAQAVIITPATQVHWEFAGPSNMDASDLQAFFNGTTDIPAYDLGGDSLFSAYKKEVDTGNESGPNFTDDYNTVFSNTPTDPSNAVITWNGPDEISFEHMFLVVKDGNQDPGIYVFDLNNLVISGSAYQWNGTDTLDIQGFWTGNGAISHVEIIAGGSDTPDEGTLPGVPEPASIAAWLLGAGAFGFVLRRRVKQGAA